MFKQLLEFKRFHIERLKWTEGRVKEAFFRFCGLKITTAPPAPVQSDYRLLTLFDRNPVKPERERDKMWKVTSDAQQRHGKTSRVRPSSLKRLLGTTVRLRAHVRTRHFPLGFPSVASAGFGTLGWGTKLRPPAIIQTVITAGTDGEPEGTGGGRAEAAPVTGV